MANNRHVWNNFYKIIYISWLVYSPPSKKIFLIIIKFITLHYINKAINTGIV